MKPLDFHPDAAEEAREAAAYYDGIRLDLGSDFQRELNAVLTHIRYNPYLYAAESGTIRICPLDRFPYSLYYEALPDRIWVAAVGHHRHQPGYWAGRRPH